MVGCGAPRHESIDSSTTGHLILVAAIALMIVMIVGWVVPSAPAVIGRISRTLRVGGWWTIGLLVTVGTGRLDGAR